MPDPWLRGLLVETFQLLKVRDFFMFLEPSQRLGINGCAIDLQTLIFLPSFSSYYCSLTFLYGFHLPSTNYVPDVFTC